MAGFYTLYLKFTFEIQTYLLLALKIVENLNYSHVYRDKIMFDSNILSKQACANNNLENLVFLSTLYIITSIVNKIATVAAMLFTSLDASYTNIPSV